MSDDTGRTEGDSSTTDRYVPQCELSAPLTSASQGPSGNVLAPLMSRTGCDGWPTGAKAEPRHIGGSRVLPQKRSPCATLLRDPMPTALVRYLCSKQSGNCVTGADTRWTGAGESDPRPLQRPLDTKCGSFIVTESGSSIRW